MEKTLENLPRQSAAGCVAVLPEQLEEFRVKVTRYFFFKLSFFTTLEADISVVCCRAETTLELSNALRDFSRLYR